MLATALILIAVISIICLAGALVVHITDDYGPACGSLAALMFVGMCAAIGMFLLRGVLL